MRRGAVRIVNTGYSLAIISNGSGPVSVSTLSWLVGWRVGWWTDISPLWHQAGKLNCGKRMRVRRSGPARAANENCNRKRAECWRPSRRKLYQQIKAPFWRQTKHDHHHHSAQPDIPPAQAGSGGRAMNYGSRISKGINCRFSGAGNPFYRYHCNSQHSFSTGVKRIQRHPTLDYCTALCCLSVIYSS